MNREERAISPGAALLFRAHKRMGFDIGFQRGELRGFFKGAFGMLALLFVLSWVLA